MRFSPKIHKLGKLRVILVPEERASVTVRVMIGTGSREETDTEAGSAHFLEHFVFKGTKKYPRMFDINEAVEKVGGAFNAYTGQNEMGFWVKMDKDHVALATEIVGQVVTEPVLPKEHFDKERGTVLEELYMYEDRPNSKAAQECEKLIYGKTNMGRPIIGTVESLKAMTIENLRTYFEKWFVAENIVVGVVGDYGSEESMLALIRKEFKSLVEEKRSLPKKDKFVWDIQKEPRMKLVSRKVEQAAVYMAFRGITMTDKRRFALELINIIYSDRRGRELQVGRGRSNGREELRAIAERHRDVDLVPIERDERQRLLREPVEPEAQRHVHVLVEQRGERARRRVEVPARHLVEEAVRGRGERLEHLKVLALHGVELVLTDAEGDLLHEGVADRVDPVGVRPVLEAEQVSGRRVLDAREVKAHVHRAQEIAGAGDRRRGLLLAKARSAVVRNLELRDGKVGVAGIGRLPESHVGRGQEVNVLSPPASELALRTGCTHGSRKEI
jgi:hypothetical protein